MLITSYLTVGRDITVADADDDDSPLSLLKFVNEAAEDLDDDAKLRIGDLLATAIADELQAVYSAR